MYRTFARLSTAKSLLRHLNDNSIPHRSSEDIVAIMSNTIDAKFSPLVADLVSKRLKGMAPTNIFQIITSIHRHRSRCLVPQTFLDSLLSEIIDGYGEDSLDSQALIRAIEMIAEIGGPRFDPVGLSNLERPNSQTPVSSLIKLYSFGGVPNMVSLSDRLAEVQSDYDLARILYLTGDKNALNRITEINHPDTIPYIIQAIAAWDLTPDPRDIPAEVIERMSPQQAQVCLWAGLVAGLNTLTINRLETVANREPWKSHAMYEQYKMKTVLGYVPPIPVRIPQLGAERKHRAVDKIRNFLTNDGFEICHNMDPNYSFDICLNRSVYLDVVTYPNDPKYRIHEKFVKANLPVVEIPIHTPINTRSISELVRPYL